jgi:hypothetical protein
MNDQRITARELRIGNWITVMGSLPTQVTAEHLYMMETYKPIDPKEANYTEMTEPIPLTEEWLLKFGFAYRNEHRGEGAILDFKTDNWKTSLSVAFDYAKNGGDIAVLTCSRKIKYVHQLQNLYFSLTGEELTIKEPHGNS